MRVSVPLSPATAATASGAGLDLAAEAVLLAGSLRLGLSGLHRSRFVVLGVELGEGWREQAP